MTGQLRHYIGGTLVEEPGGWKDLTQEVERDLSDRLIYVKYPVSLRFQGSGYALLRSAYENEMCASLPYSCTQECGQAEQTVITGLIYLTDITWNLSKCVADTPITDSTIAGLVLNNKDIPVYPTSVLSKNGETITPATLIDLEVFDSGDPLGTYEATTRAAYDWLECMNHTVQYITDGQCSVVSDWYTSLPDDERYAILNGVNVRTGSAGDKPPTYKFKDLYAALWKSYSLMGALEFTNTGAPYIRIEPESYFWGLPSGIDFPYTDDLEQTVDTERLWATVRLGSEGAIKNEDNVLPLPYLVLRTFANEEYHLSGQCNTDSALELRNPFVICTNAIQNAVVNNDETNDEKVFMIQYDHTTSLATKGDYLTQDGTVPFLYNEQLQNQLVMARWEVQAQGVNYFGTFDTGFQAQNVGGGWVSGNLTAFGAPATFTSYAGPALTFTDDSTPPNNNVDGNWNTGTNQYTAPTQGYYEFFFNYAFIVVSTITPGFPPSIPFVRARVVFNHYDSGATLLNTQSVYSSLGQSFPPSIDAVAGFIMNPTDYVSVEIFFEVTKSLPPDASLVVQLFDAYTIGTDFVAEGGGTFNPVDPNDYHVIKLKFSRAIDLETWQGYLTDFSKSIGVSPDDSTARNGYASNISRKVATGETTWELVTNRQGRI